MTAVKTFPVLPAIVFIITLGFAGASAAQQTSALRNHDTSQAIDISADELEVRQRDNLAVFSGAVEARQGDMTFFADSVTVYYADGGDALNPSIDRLDAEGNVRLTSPSESATSNWAVYDVNGGLMTLGGSVVLAQGDSVLRGERLVINLESGVTRFEGGEADVSGRVRGRFSTPDDEDETEDEDPPRD